MITTHDLKDIPEDVRNQAIHCLDDLLTMKNEKGKPAPVITGYNWYTTLPASNRIVTFSHMHETEAYKQDMLKDLAVLGYDPQRVLQEIRYKGSAFLWDHNFEIRDHKGNILHGLRIKDKKVQQYIDLEQFVNTLGQDEKLKQTAGDLVGESQGWELDFPFHSKEELLNLVNMFLMKSGKFIYDEQGTLISETVDERKARAPWTDAYQTPVLLIGEAALRYANELPHFVPATKITLKMNSNEISFIIHKNLDRLRELPHYQALLQMGFTEEQCLGNNQFVTQYVDKKR